MAQPLFVLQPFRLVWPLLVPKGANRAWVMGSETLVIIICRSVSLKVGDGDYRLVDRELLVVHAKTMTLGIGVGEQTSLKDRICRWLDSGDKMGGRESNLFNLSEVVLGVLVEHEFPKLAEREVLLRPDLGEVKDIVTEFLCLFWSHSLLREDAVVSKRANPNSQSHNAYNIGGPGWVLFTLDRLEKALDSIVRI